MRPFLPALLACGLVLPAAAQTQPDSQPTSQPSPPSTTAPAGGTRPHNVLFFVADGLRAGMVTARTAPAMTALMERGVRFANTHSLFPTFTTANASAMATGHMLGDTGDFSNVIYTGFPVQAQGGSVTPFLENDPVLDEVDDHFAGNYLNEETILKAASTAGLSTAAIGKVGPAMIFDSADRQHRTSIVVDDQTGRGGAPLSDEVKSRLDAAGLPAQAPTRGENAPAGNSTTPGTRVANLVQQDWFVRVAADAVLPLFKARNQPFMMVYWSRDPDGTQHNQGDSLLRLVPGISGPTSLAAIRNADDNLARLLAALKAQGLDGDTDVILTSDHGFSTISKESATSWSATQENKGVPAGMLPAGFVAMDIAHALGLPAFDPDQKNAPLTPAGGSPRGNGLIGPDPDHPQIVVAANGGSDLIYIPGADKDLARRVVGILAAQDYTSGLFVDHSLGPIPGTLPLSAIALEGTAVTPMPAIAINFRSFSTGCADPTTCGVEVADTGLQQGQGMHGSFSRADTRNIMGAAGPDFRAGFVDPAPASNADLGRTVAAVTRLAIADKGKLVGRVLTEAMPDGALPEVQAGALRSDPDEAGRVTVLLWQKVGETHYFDAAGYPGRTLGVPADAVQPPERRAAR